MFVPNRSPLLTVDVIIETLPDHFLLIHRSNPPHGWALVGGFVEYGEPLWRAAKRKVQEEIGLPLEMMEQFYTYSDPHRDSRAHAVTTVFTGKLLEPEKLKHNGATPHNQFGRAPTKQLKEFSVDTIPPLMFDHSEILQDYIAWKRTGIRPIVERRVPDGALKQAV